MPTTPKKEGTNYPKYDVMSFERCKVDIENGNYQQIAKSPHNRPEGSDKSILLHELLAIDGHERTKGHSRRAYFGISQRRT